MEAVSATIRIRTAPSLDQSGYFLGVAQAAIVERKSVLVESLNKDGKPVWLAIFPERKIYYTTVTDGRRFYQTPASGLTVKHLDEELPTQFHSMSGRPVEELLWRAAYYVFEGKLTNECTVFDVVRLRHWPNLTRLPTTPNTFKIFALISRHATSIGLLHRILGIGKEEVWQVVSAAYSAGLIEKVNCNVAMLNKMQAEAEQSPPATVQGFFRSLLTKITGL